MSRKEDIDNGIWSDPDFEALSRDATLLYLWSWTNPRCGMAGLYKVSQRAMQESKIAPDDIPAALDELAAARFCFYEAGVMFVRTRAKHLRQKTEQIAKSIRADVAKIPGDHPMRQRFLEEYRDAIWLRGVLSEQSLATVTEGSPEGQGVSPPGRDSLTLKGRSSDRLGQRQGQRHGKGQGPGPEVEKTRAWVSEHFPDLPPDAVFGVVVRFKSSGVPLVPDAVRAAVIERHPYLGETAA